MIANDQYEELTKRGLNVSWLMREFLDDYFNANHIKLKLSEETRVLFGKIVGAGQELGEEFEPYLRKALKEMLKEKINIMQKLEKHLSQKDKN